MNVRGTLCPGTFTVMCGTATGIQKSRGVRTVTLRPPKSPQKPNCKFYIRYHGFRPDSLKIFLYSIYYKESYSKKVSYFKKKPYPANMELIFVTALTCLQHCDTEGNGGYIGTSCDQQTCAGTWTIQWSTWELAKDTNNPEPEHACPS